jgi:hypothetical protein
MLFKKRVFALGAFPLDLHDTLLAGNQHHNASDDLPPRQISLQPKRRVFQGLIPRISGQQLRDIIVVVGIIYCFPEGRHSGK